MFSYSQDEGDCNLNLSYSQLSKTGYEQPPLVHIFAVTTCKAA